MVTLLYEQVSVILVSYFRDCAMLADDPTEPERLVPESRRKETTIRADTEKQLLLRLAQDADDDRQQALLIRIVEAGDDLRGRPTDSQAAIGAAATYFTSAADLLKLIERLPR